jgi:lysozyme family protein
MMSHEDDPKTTKDDYISANKDELGGETYRGISRKMHPEWEGWKIVDDHKVLPNFPLSLSTDTKLQGMIKCFYKKDFWDLIHGDQIDNQRIANKLFDATVNPGPISIKLIQQALRDIHTSNNGVYITPFVLNIDGKIGSATLNAIKGAGEEELLKAFEKQLKDYYDSRHNEKYQNGWENRAKAD